MTSDKKIDLIGRLGFKPDSVEDGIITFWDSGREQNHSIHENGTLAHMVEELMSYAYGNGRYDGEFAAKSEIRKALGINE